MWLNRLPKSVMLKDREYDDVGEQCGLGWRYRNIMAAVNSVRCGGEDDDDDDDIDE